jgi:hypothetical protein
MHPDSHSCLQNKFCTLTNICLRSNLYRDAAPVPFTNFIYREKHLAIYQTCTATAPVFYKICTMTAKSAPYLPCTGTIFGPAGAGYQDPAQMLRQVTLTTPTTGPLCVMPAYRKCRKNAAGNTMQNFGRTN